MGQRTREALAVKRAQGVRLGRPPVLSQELVDRVVHDRARGMALKAIADALSEDGIPTARGGACWYPSTIRAILEGQAAGTTSR